MVEKAQKGQALVEFALVITIMVFVALNVVDFAIRIVNNEVAQYTAFQASRQASIYLNDGSQSCDSFVRSHISQPIFLLMESWDLTLTGCPTDPSWSQVTGSTVTATVSWTQDAVWWKDPSSFPGSWIHSGDAVQKDVFQ